jgi:hypothetical protein
MISGYEALAVKKTNLKGPLCNKRKLVIETVNGEIYGSSC